MFARIPDAIIQNIYDKKPRRTGAWVLSETGWFYTARPETYRQGFGSEKELSLPFWKTPDHMKIED
jgi:hypothetical protein